MSSVLADLRAGRDPCKNQEFTHLLLAATHIGNRRTPALVRRATRAALLAVAYPAAALDDIEYAVNELITNSVVHSPGSTIRLRLIEHTVGGTLTCVVCDDGPGMPVIRTDTELEPARESGYGLASIAVLAARIEQWPCRHGKAIAFQYATPV
ncbi:ATP-binding protein [Streptomycetaceae bacterium NBC_01309]